MNNSKDNKRIVKNTIFLYIKLIISTIIGLYVSKEVLHLLGEDNFGLYSVVGGLVALMNFFSTVMSSTSYRFIAVEIGKGESGNINKTFNTIIVIHFVLALLILLLGFTIGVWYIDNYLNIAPVKIPDAKFVLNTSIIIGMTNVLSVPFLGLLVAREKFLYNALVEIIYTVLKLLLIVFVLSQANDKLRTYALLMLGIEIIKVLFISVYCAIKDTQTIRWNFNNTYSDYKEIFAYSSWVMLGASACIGQTQGLAIIINRFFSTVVNAAFGIAQQINGYILMFVRSITQAAVPQMIKSYSGGNTDRTISLLNRITKYSFFIMAIPSVPCIICMPDILDLWLESSPVFTSEFARLMLVNGLVTCLGSGFDSTIQATGKIKIYQIGFSLIYIMTLPISIILFSFGFSPYSIIVANITLSIFQLLWQMRMLTNLTDFKISCYYKSTIKPVIKVSLLILPLFGLSYISSSSLLTIISICIITTIYILIAICSLGLEHNEKKLIAEIFNKIIKK